MKELEHKLNYRFKNPDLLREALTHRSFSATNNERLEYLGDAALNLIIANFLFRTFPDLVEGEMTRLRAALVNQDGLSKVARHLDIGTHIRLGGGEVKTGGAERASILADTLEAIVGRSISILDLIMQKPSFWGCIQTYCRTSIRRISGKILKHVYKNIYRLINLSFLSMMFWRFQVRRMSNASSSSVS